MRATLMQGEGFCTMIRPVAQESVIDSGFVLVLGTNGSYLDSSGQRILDLPRVKIRPQQSELITIVSQNHQFEVTLNCDTIVKRMTSRMESDDIVFSTLPKSTVRIEHPYWTEVDDDTDVTHLSSVATKSVSGPF